MADHTQQSRDTHTQDFGLHVTEQGDAAGIAEQFKGSHPGRINSMIQALSDASRFAGQDVTSELANIKAKLADAWGGSKSADEALKVIDDLHADAIEISDNANTTHVALQWFQGQWEAYKDYFAKDIDSGGWPFNNDNGQSRQAYENFVNDQVTTIRSMPGNVTFHNPLDGQPAPAPAGPAPAPAPAPAPPPSSPPPSVPPPSVPPPSEFPNPPSEQPPSLPPPSEFPTPSEHPGPSGYPGPSDYSGPSDYPGPSYGSDFPGSPGPGSGLDTGSQLSGLGPGGPMAGGLGPAGGIPGPAGAGLGPAGIGGAGMGSGIGGGMGTGMGPAGAGLGPGGAPGMMPMGGRGGHGEGDEHELERSTWLEEDEDIWDGADAPPDLT